MADYIDTLRRTLDELVRQRQHIDADIEDIARIIRRHEGTPSVSAQPTPRSEGRASAPGEGRRATLALMADGAYWTPSKLADARGTSTNAARVMLRRISEEPSSPIERTDRGYRLVSPPAGDAQGSLSVAAEREEPGEQEGVEDVVSRASA